MYPIYALYNNFIVLTYNSYKSTINMIPLDSLKLINYSKFKH